jgi:Cu/Zn superoxide dismutase
MNVRYIKQARAGAHLAFACAAAAALTAPVLADDMGSMHMTPMKSFPISAQNGSGETGTVTLTPMGSSTKVVVTLSGAPAEAQPAHIHPGTCAKLDPVPKYPLTNVVDGKSTTTVAVSVATLTAGGFAVNVHKSTSDLKDYVACGDLTSAPAPMASGRM